MDKSFKSLTLALGLCLTFQVQAGLLLGKVIHVQDGDSITVLDDTRTQHKIRLSGIDAPESRQAFGQRSKQHLSDLCFQEQATITPRAMDKYGRTVGDVECQGKDVATAQVRAGMAWYYVKYGKGYEQLQDIEQAARQAGRGLWSQPAEPPWEWRRSLPHTRHH